MEVGRAPCPSIRRRARCPSYDRQTHRKAFCILMLNLCIEELHRIVGGEVRLGLMPPLAGTLEPLRRVVVDSSRARPGDVYWALVGPDYDGAQTAEEAFTRGALGVVVSSRSVEPWAGKFVLRVPDANQAL